MTAEAARTVAAAFISCPLDCCNSLFCGLPDTLLRKLQACAERHYTTDHWHATSWSHHAGTTRTLLAAHPRACQVQSRMSGSSSYKVSQLQLHNRTQNSSDNLPCYLQTNIIAEMLSIGGEGVKYKRRKEVTEYTMCSSQKWLWFKKRQNEYLTNFLRRRFFWRKHRVLSLQLIIQLWQRRPVAVWHLTVVRFFFCRTRGTIIDVNERRGILAIDVGGRTLLLSTTSTRRTPVAD